MSVVVSDRKKRNDVEEDDNIYYNIKIVGSDTDGNLPAVYNVSRTAPILYNPSNYELAVVRFSIPTFEIPLMVWGLEPWQPNPKLPNYNPSSKVGKFSVSMEYDGVEHTEFLEFIPNSTINQPQFGNAVYNLQELVNIINKAFAKCFWNNFDTTPPDPALTPRFPLAPPSTPPRMVFNAETQLLTIVFEEAYELQNPSISNVPLTETIKVFCNRELHALFPSFEFNYFAPSNSPYGPQLRYQWLPYNLQNNINSGNPLIPANQIWITQGYDTQGLMEDFQTILFETDHIPVESEFQPTINDTTRRILTDFQTTGKRDSDEVQYFGSGWKRYYNLKSDNPLNTIDLRALWEDKWGQTYPIIIGVNDTLTMKLLFRKKTALQLDEIDYSKDLD